MMELFDTAPAIDVDPAEYARLLGYPRQHVLTDRAAELAHGARTWYAEHGRPWLYARQCGSLSVGREITIDGTLFSSPRLEQMLRAADASSAFLIAVSAGQGAEAEAQRLWREEKPDEYFFLEIYGSAVVEHLVTLAGARLCAWADGNGMAVLPHYSPGYPEWDISQQPRLLELIKRGADRPLPQLETLETGMLRPKKSLLAVFGLTAHTERVQRLTNLVPCQNCSFARCEYRRAPYRRASDADTEVAAVAAGTSLLEAAPPEALFQLTQNARYLVNRRALERWTRERLTLTQHADGTIEALFRFEGTTCSNMGRTLLFHYQVKLGPRDEGYPVRQMACAPADEGYKSMCRYLSHPQQLMLDIQSEKSLLEKPLEEIFNWDRPTAAPACYCEPTSRRHKWGLALETIHFALVQAENARPATATTKKELP